ncbi:helix-turn-helix domain-containing protein [Actinokineospora auranticolor]|uniref:Helix-turn-helix protein n=1 Tax=Actinokineospora auranticolor TaxID=155976 RepID=A0A2S6GPC4_9PSEU|nr:helix-turn-helix domain-containing protein [Actinokineospora auranticolor]PPK67084.1 helix-turn-helix protein [Actinokineospora auranticolor]
MRLTFRCHLDTTPVAYLRRVRLGCARPNLRAATPGQDTVTRIAARWGYGHLACSQPLMLVVDDVDSFEWLTCVGLAHLWTRLVEWLWQ